MKDIKRTITLCLTDEQIGLMIGAMECSACQAEETGLQSGKDDAQTLDYICSQIETQIK